MGRAAQPAELAPSYVFLASQESSYITADVIAVTGRLADRLTSSGWARWGGGTTGIALGRAVRRGGQAESSESR
jgi:hypothetical protein